MPLVEQQALTELLCFPWQRAAAGDEEAHPEVLGCAAGTAGTQRGRGFPLDQEQPRLLLLRHLPSWYLPARPWGLECSRSAPKGSPCPSREMAGAEMEVAAEQEHFGMHMTLHSTDALQQEIRAQAHTLSAHTPD